uniref:Uncharacterized protein n=1 Tax=Solanum lycopersicum TaxID=4081 RepID=K4D0Z7_SOLLC
MEEVVRLMFSLIRCPKKFNMLAFEIDSIKFRVSFFIFFSDLRFC